MFHGNIYVFVCVFAVGWLHCPVSCAVGREPQQLERQNGSSELPQYMARSAVRAIPPAALSDSRFINTGLNISSGFGYADQPQVVVRSDGAWQVVLTVNSAHEGQFGQQVVSAISMDEGRSWTTPVLVEPRTNLTSGWINNQLVPAPAAASAAGSSDRIFAFYTFNKGNVTTDPRTGRPLPNANLIGPWVYRVSDDGGATWSSERWEIPIRETGIDRTNAWNGSVREGWSVGKPIAVRGGTVAMMQFSKVSTAAASSEGFFLASDNLLVHGTDPGDVKWTLLPDGDHGLRASCGTVAEEGSLVELSSGHLYAVYRTTCGVANSATSTDGGRTWVDAQPLAYARADYGSAMYSPAVKQPRGPLSIRKLRRADLRGMYLTTVYVNSYSPGWDNRNPYFFLAGWESSSGGIEWSQPEVGLYLLPPCEDPRCGIGYPDFIQPSDSAGSPVWITETDKVTARLHRINDTLLHDLYTQRTARTAAASGLVINASQPSRSILSGPASWSVSAPASWGTLSAGSGLTLELSLSSAVAAPVSDNPPLLDCRSNATGQGFAVILNSTSGQVVLALDDGAGNFQQWSSDPQCPVAPPMSSSSAHHVVVSVDGLSRFISFLVDGVFNDGGDARPQGWAALNPVIGDLGGGGRCAVARCVQRVRAYGRYLRTSEAIANWRSTT